MASGPVRVGVLGTANIARTNLRGMEAVPDSACAVAVGSRDEHRARAFADEFGVPRAHGSYDAVLEDVEVDAVYVPLPTSAHAEWVVKAARAGKHVLCEKPCALTAAELLEMLRACHEAGVQFMDGVFFMHHRRLRSMRAFIDDGRLGASGATHITSTFTFRGDEDFFKSNIRMDPKLDGLGALGDLGWYTARLALWAFGWELPRLASGVMVAQRDGVPADLCGTLVWGSSDGNGSGNGPDDGSEEPSGLPVTRSASFHVSFLHQSQQLAVVAGPEGCLTLHDFVIAVSEEGARWESETRRGDHETDTAETEAVSRETHRESACRQESEMWRAFAERVRGERPDTFWPRASLLTQLCMDAVLKSARNERGAQVRVDPEGLLRQFDDLK